MTRIATKPIAAVFTAVCLCAAGCGVAKSDGALVQGTWMTIAGSDNGKSFPPPEEKQGKVVVTGDEFAMYEDATSPPQKWSFHLDPAKSPKQIDFDLGDKQAPGIYELDGDHWKVAMIMPGKPRPTDFKGADFTLVLEMKRGEPAAPASPPAQKSADNSGGNESAHKPASEKIPADKSSEKSAADDSPPGAIAKQKPMAEFLDAHKPAADIVDAIGNFHAAVFESLAKENPSAAKPTAKP